MEYECGFSRAESTAAILFRHRNADKAGIRQRPTEVFGKLTGAVTVEPVVIIETAADLEHALTDLALLDRKLHVHHVS